MGFVALTCYLVVGSGWLSTRKATNYAVGFQLLSSLAHGAMPVQRCLQAFALTCYLFTRSKYALSLEALVTSYLV